MPWPIVNVIVALAVAYVLCLTIVGLPFGFLLPDSVPAFLTLRRS